MIIALSYVMLLAYLPLLYSTVRNFSINKITDAVYVRNLFKDYLRTLPAVGIVSLPIIVFPEYANIISVVLHLIFAPLVMLELGHIYLFNSRIGLNTFYSLFVTNWRETIEYVHQNISLLQMASALVLWLCPIGFLLQIHGTSWHMATNCGIAVVADVLMILPLVCNVLKPERKHKRAYFLNPFINLVYHYILFKRKYASLCKMIRERKMPPFTDIVSCLPAGVRQTYVIVIGESANSMHHSYCGYRRDTNEFTDRLGNSIFRFKGVTSQFAQTLPSLEKVLTFADTDNPELLYKNGSIVDYFKDAGFKVWWYSNQYALEDTAITAMTTRADVKKCFNYGDYKRSDATGYDGNMLDDFKCAIADNAERKVIFLHLIGSHAAYVNRYPAEFKHYCDITPEMAMLESSAREFVNAYDDSIRYTDWVICELIRALESTNDAGWMMYFSDHGEDVYDTRKDKLLGHSEIANVPMTSVPLMFWFSNALNALRPDIRLRANKAKEVYKLEDIIHFIIDVASLRNYNWHPEKSLLPLDANSK